MNTLGKSKNDESIADKIKEAIEITQPYNKPSVNPTPYSKHLNESERQKCALAKITDNVRIGKSVFTPEVLRKLTDLVAYSDKFYPSYGFLGHEQVTFTGPGTFKYGWD